MQNPTIALRLLIEHTRFEILVWGCGGLVLWLFVWSLGFTCWISFALVFGFVCCSVLVFAWFFFWYLDLYVLGDGALMGLGLSCGLDFCVS